MSAKASAMSSKRNPGFSAAAGLLDFRELGHGRETNRGQIGRKSAADSKPQSSDWIITSCPIHPIDCQLTQAVTGNDHRCASRKKSLRGDRIV